jgi:uncharacterized Zn finger protein
MVSPAPVRGLPRAPTPPGGQSAPRGGSGEEPVIRSGRDGGDGRPGPVAQPGRRMADEDDANGTGADSRPLGSAVVFCDACGKETVHRILRLEPASRAGGTVVRGVARCRECRWTHPFTSERAPKVAVDLIVSSGASSRRDSVELAPSEPLRVGELLPSSEIPARVRRLELRRGGQATEAEARLVRTAWVADERAGSVRIAVLDGARSSTERLPASGVGRWVVGALVRLPSGMARVVALRARGHTWRREGDAFAAAEVSVVYARRISRPPAGRRLWSRERLTSSSRASSTSRSERSRSSPGRSRKRTVPRARTADGGATDRNSSSS